MHKLKYLTEKDLEEGKEIYEMIAPLSDAGKEAIKNILLGMNLNEQVHKKRQTA